MLRLYRYVPLLLLMAAPACSKCSSSHGAESAADQLKTEDLVVGTGVEAKKGKTVTIHVLGKTADGHVFENTKSRGEPLKVVLGEGRVIPGLEQGIYGMLVTGKRRITVPPALGYKNQEAGGLIPPNSTLVFEVDLLDVR